MLVRQTPHFPHGRKRITLSYRLFSGVQSGDRTRVRMDFECGQIIYNLIPPRPNIVPRRRPRRPRRPPRRPRLLYLIIWNFKIKHYICGKSCDMTTLGMMGPAQTIIVIGLILIVGWWLKSIIRIITTKNRRRIIKAEDLATQKTGNTSGSSR